MRRGLVVGLTALATVASGCGGGDHSTPTGRTSAAPRPSAHVLVALKRWTGTDPVVSEVTIQSDGTARARRVAGGLTGMRTVTRELPARRFARLRALAARTRLRGAGTGADPTGGGYTYVLRIGDRSVRTADGHLRPGVRPLITALDRVWDRMLSA